MSVYTNEITQKVFPQFFVYNIGPSHDQFRYKNSHDDNNNNYT